MSDQSQYQAESEVERPETSGDARARDESVIRREVGGTVEIAYTDEGWDSRVYVVNGGEAVFKFPRAPDTIRQYKREIAAMRLVNTIDSPVLTPRVKWEGPGLAYFGYEGITGDQLARRITTLSSEEKTGTGVLLGQFLQRLHSAELPGAPRTDLKTKIEEYRQKYLLAKPALIRAFSEREVQSIEHFLLVELADGLKRLGSDMRLCHSDLGPWNIILNRTGIPGDSIAWKRGWSHGRSQAAA